jgi:hypothetical protein
MFRMNDKLILFFFICFIGLICEDDQLEFIIGIKGLFLYVIIMMI